MSGTSHLLWSADDTLAYPPSSPLTNRGEIQGKDATLWTKKKYGFEWPDFSNAVTRLPTIEGAKTWLDNVIDNPPKGIVSYYTGHAEKLRCRWLLNPGQRVLSERSLKDIWEPHYHVGDDMSCAAMHTEDMSSRDKDGTVHGLRFANAVLVGIKIWMLISLGAETKFKRFVDKNFGVIGRWDRAISHPKILVSPSRLDAEGIAYTIKVGYPGNLVLTEQAQHHMVVNMGPCIAESVGFALTGDSIRSSNFARCDLDGLDLCHQALRVSAPPVSSKLMHVEKQVQLNKRSRVERQTTSGAGPSRTVNTRESRRSFEQALAALPSETVETRESRGRAALERVAGHLRSVGHVFITPIILNTLPSDRIYRLMCSFLSGATIIAFYELAVAWNLDSSPFSRAEHAEAKAKTASE